MAHGIKNIPSGKITLLNGSVLDCYPQGQDGNTVDYGFLDVDTEEYKSGIRKERLRELWNAYSDETVLQLFLDNAFLFLDSSNLVFSDSRIFLSPIPIRHKLLLKDDTALRNPTLGVFVEWWRTCRSSDFMDSDGKEWIVCRLYGYPLTGTNKCDILNRNGETRHNAVRSFNEAWHAFADINSRYDDAKSKYMSYTLRESLFVLSKEHIHVNIDRQVDPLLYSECKHDDILESILAERHIQKPNHNLFE